MDRVEAYLAGPRGKLRFSPEIEARYHAQAVETRARHAFWAGLVALMALNLLLLANVFSREIIAQVGTRAQIADHLTSTIPSLGLLFLVRRSREPWAIDLYMASGCLLVTIGALLLNHVLTPQTRLFDAFTLVLIPIAGNIALPMSFDVAVGVSSIVAAAFSADVVARAEFSATAQQSLILVFLAGTVLTLVANYRFEHAERTNFLMLLRESLRNADVVRANEELSTASRTDFLTGLANRRDFDARLAEVLEASRREGRPVMALIADVDHFKLYNDRLGHLQGDKCLQSVAEAITESLRAGRGFAGRFGGEEFAIVLPGVDAGRAGPILEDIRASVAARRIAHPGLGKDRFLTISIGAASMNPAYPEDAASLLGRADEALYRAKRGGRDRAEIDLRAEEA